MPWPINSFNRETLRPLWGLPGRSSLASGTHVHTPHPDLPIVDFPSHPPFFQSFDSLLAKQTMQRMPVSAGCLLFCRCLLHFTLLGGLNSYARARWYHVRIDRSKSMEATKLFSLSLSPLTVTFLGLSMIVIVSKQDSSFALPR